MVSDSGLVPQATDSQGNLALRVILICQGKFINWSEPQSSADSRACAMLLSQSPEVGLRHLYFTDTPWVTQMCFQEWKPPAHEKEPKLLIQTGLGSSPALQFISCAVRHKLADLSETHFLYL